MQELFGSLSQAVEGAPTWALSAAFVWGILSIILSPCHLASIPLIVGFVDSQGRISTGRAFWISSLFSFGIMVTIAAIGGITAAAGRIAGDLGPYANYGVAVVFFVVGLYLVGVLKIPWSGGGLPGIRGKGLAAAFVLGILFGVALGPCTFAYMAPMLGVTFRVAAESLAYGIGLLMAFAIGHCGVIVLAGTSTELVQKYLNWNESSRGAVILRVGCGILVMLAGCYLIWSA